MNYSRSFTFKNRSLSSKCVYEILSNDKISTGLGDKLYASHNKVSLNPRRSPRVSSNTKPITGPCG